MKKLFLFILLLAAGTALGFYYLRSQELAVTLSQADLQERLEEAFPVEKSYLVLLTLRLTEPEVTLVDGSDRIHYRMRASVVVPGREFSGTGRISGEVRFDAETRELYLDRSVVEELDIAGVPPEYRTPLREAADLAAGQQLDRRPVYTVEEEVFERLPKAVAVRDVRVVDGKVRISFGLADRFWTKLGIGGKGD